MDEAATDVRLTREEWDKQFAHYLNREGERYMRENGFPLHSPMAMIAVLENRLRAIEKKLGIGWHGDN